MKIIFVGDIAYPYINCINAEQISSIFNDSIGIGNLEGQIIDNNFRIIDNHKYNLYSNSSIINILKTNSIKFLCLANNHILDFKNHIKDTISILNQNSIEIFGTSSKPFIDLNKEVRIYGLVTNITGGNFVGKGNINRFNPIKLLEEIQIVRENEPHLTIIIYIHWGYELAEYPQPADREWAHNAIDKGANYIIGHHPHVIQGAEKYNNGFIFYSIGNFILPQVEFLDHKLQYFDSRVQNQLCIQLDTSSPSEITLFLLHYNKQRSTINLINSYNSIDNNEFRLLTPFKGFNNKTYKNWFQSNKNRKGILNTNPTYNSYFSFLGFEKYFLDSYLKILWKIRKILINLKIHKPYNW